MKRWRTLRPGLWLTLLLAAPAMGHVPLAGRLACAEVARAAVAALPRLVSEPAPHQRQQPSRSVVGTRMARAIAPVQPTATAAPRFSELYIRYRALLV